MMKACQVAGVGNRFAPVQVFMANRPNFYLPGDQCSMMGIDIDVINSINQACGNGWRKVFNVYAKWMFSLHSALETQAHNVSWQAYRDATLLRAGGETALWFAPPAEFDAINLNIVMGKGYAATLNLTSSMEWVTHDFAFCLRRNLVVTPYFDYRQLSNEKIRFLNYLIKSRLLSAGDGSGTTAWLPRLRAHTVSHRQ